MKHLLSLLVVAALAPSTAEAQDRFTFGGFSFDEGDTPDQVVALDSGMYAGALITATPSSATSSVGFPDSDVGFDTAQAIGAFLNAANGPRAVNLPSGNNGTIARSGVVLSYSDNRHIPNPPGIDFVLFESASNEESPEAVMIQVFDADSMSWSPWYYEPADSFALYNGSSAAGAMAIVIDLDKLGFGPTAEITQIRIANMTDEDRMEAGQASGGFVIPEDNGATAGSELPAPPPFAGFTEYGSNTLDPDPLYLAVMIDRLFADGFED